MAILAKALVSLCKLKTINIAFSLGRDRPSVRGVGGWVFIFRILKSILFLLIKFSFTFFISNKILPYYVCSLLLYLEWVVIRLFTVYSTVFPKGLITEWDSSLGSVYYFLVHFIPRMHLHSGYHYYNHVIIGVLGPQWILKVLFWIGLTQSKRLIKQLIIKIIIIGRRDFFLSSQLCFFPYYAFHLSFLVCLFVLLHSCCFHARVFGKTHSWVPNFLKPHWMVLAFFSLVQEKLNMPSGHNYRRCSGSGRKKHLIIKKSRWVVTHWGL